MGRGDKRSRKGKIFAGSFGKTRQKAKKKHVAPQTGGAAPETTPKKATRKKKAE
jgi:ribosomal small subunit protein bTHX